LLPGEEFPFRENDGTTDQAQVRTPVPPGFLGNFEVAAVLIGVHGTPYKPDMD